MHLPKEQFDLEMWLGRFAAKVEENAVELGLSPEQAAEMTDLAALFKQLSADHSEAMLEARRIGAMKERARADAEALARRIARRVQLLMPEDVILFGLDPPKMRSRVPVPKLTPKLAVRALDKGRIEVKFRGGGQRGGKPRNVRACEIWVKIGGDPPTTIRECTGLATATRSPHIATFDTESIGETAHFIARWINPRSQPGPSSPAASATIPL